jgi:hypothetical protein
VSRHDASRLTDIVEAIEAIKDHLAGAPDPTDASLAGIFDLL